MKKSRLSAFKKGKLLGFFTLEVTARNAAKILDINHKSSAYFSHRLRQIIFEKTTLKKSYAKNTTPFSKNYPSYP